jgi:hypothetical protein
MDQDPGSAAAARAIAAALTGGQAAALLAEAARRWPARDRPAGVPGTLRWIGLYATVDAAAVFYAAHEDEVPDAPGTAYAVYALALTGQPLTVTTVTGLLARAGLHQPGPTRPPEPPAGLPVTLLDGDTPARHMLPADGTWTIGAITPAQARHVTALAGAVRAAGLGHLAAAAVTRILGIPVTTRAGDWQPEPGESAIIFGFLTRPAPAGLRTTITAPELRAAGYTLRLLTRTS